ncbi:unnamed protein product [Hyaloperonospora brassicae]|uniref:BHLH domain-containing protein n=1 Tax=Hyaloperonospora brassicae TaxID=162125 RepID=A0AAV0UVJ1_HYABA|nr:unnamed protein product [Hyaloperonospora brassicae]
MDRQRHASRRRRPSYLVQQDEKRKLAQELSVLQSLLADIQARPKTGSSKSSIVARGDAGESYRQSIVQTRLHAKRVVGATSSAAEPQR